MYEKLRARWARRIKALLLTVAFESMNATRTQTQRIKSSLTTEIQVWANPITRWKEASSTSRRTQNTEQLYGWKGHKNTSWPLVLEDHKKHGQAMPEQPTWRINLTCYFISFRYILIKETYKCWQEHCEKWRTNEKKVSLYMDLALHMLSTIWRCVWSCRLLLWFIYKKGRQCFDYNAHAGSELWFVLHT
jgi:hypothetical protein